MKTFPNENPTISDFDFVKEIYRFFLFVNIPLLKKCNSLTAIKCLHFFSHFLLFVYSSFFFIEIRSRISTTAAMVWSTATVCKSIAIWIFKCYPSSWGHLAPWYVFHHAWRFQGSDYSDAFCATNLSQRHNKLPNEVWYNL